MFKISKTFAYTLQANSGSFLGNSSANNTMAQLLWQCLWGFYSQISRWGKSVKSRMKNGQLQPLHAKGFFREPPVTSYHTPKYFLYGIKTSARFSLAQMCRIFQELNSYMVSLWLLFLGGGERPFFSFLTDAFIHLWVYYPISVQSTKNASLEPAN